MDWKIIARARAILEKEQGCITKDWGGKVPIALVYPNAYYVGMSNLGFQTVYRLFNREPGIVCERAFADETLRDKEGFISLESQRPLSDFPVIAFSIPYELDYFNLALVLRHSNIPLYAEERVDGDPIIIAGGPAVSANPEPLALLVDAFVIGEGEEIIPRLAEVFRETITSPRAEALERLRRIPGVYVPALHRPDDKPVPRQWVRHLDDYPTHSVVLTWDTEFGDMYLIEIGRGCGRGCRFCLAGHIYRPPRERSVEALLEQAREGLQWRDTIGLVSAAVSDYSRMDELAEELMTLGGCISVSSLRVETVSEKLLKALAQSGTRTITLAPEAGSERLRRIIGKPITDRELFRAVELAARYRIPRLKLYFMLGLPGERDEDVEAAITLVGEIRRRFPGEVSVNLSPFVPKAHTPFQWVAMAPVEVIKERVKRLKRGLMRQGVEVQAESPAWAAIQGVLSRGDRKLGRILVEIAHRDEGATLHNWRDAMEKAGLDEAEYIRERGLDEKLPWSVVDMSVRMQYLRQRLEEAFAKDSLSG
ncbi:MAG TPA: radical SAM protein [Chloroflexi bacterium]|nr:radical SAM protein [Chloroflexota bacterium]